MKYRKKPVIVEAEQFFPDKKPWPKGAIESNRIYLFQTSCFNYLLHPGDWIVQQENGDQIVCKPDIFESTYEQLEEQ